VAWGSDIVVVCVCMWDCGHVVEVGFVFTFLKYETRRSARIHSTQAESNRAKPSQACVCVGSRTRAAHLVRREIVVIIAAAPVGIVDVIIAAVAVGVGCATVRVITRAVVGARAARDWAADVRVRPVIAHLVAVALGARVTERNL